MEAEITQLGGDAGGHQLHNEADTYGEDIRHYQPMHIQHQQQLPPQQYQYRKDPFSDMDKTTYIIIFVAFIIGFFMGKTMQPVILKSL